MKKLIYLMLFLVSTGLFIQEFTDIRTPYNLRRVKEEGSLTKALLYSIEHHTTIEQWLIDFILPKIAENDIALGRFDRDSHPLLRMGASEFMSHLAESGAEESLQKIRALAQALVIQEFNPELTKQALEGIFTGLNQIFDYNWGKGEGFRYNLEEEVNRYYDLFNRSIVSGAIIPENFPSDVEGAYLASRISIYYGNALKNVQSISALFGISRNDFIKAVAPNPALWKESILGTGVLRLDEFEQLIQDLKDKSIIAQDIDSQDYYPIYLKNFFAFADARQVESDEILPFLENLFSGNIAESTQMLYPGYSDYLLPQEALPGEINHARGMRDRSIQELRGFLIQGPDDLRAFAAAEITRRVNKNLLNPRGEGLPLIRAFASLNYAWDLLPEPVSEGRRQMRFTESIVLFALKELTKEVAEALNLEHPDSLAHYATVRDPVTGRVKTTKHPVVKINGQFVKIIEVDRKVEGGDGFYTYSGVDIYGNPVRFIDEYSPLDLRESGIYRILNWDGYIWPQELFGAGAFTPEYRWP